MKEKPIKEGVFWYAPAKKGGVRTIGFGSGRAGYMRASQFLKGFRIKGLLGRRKN